MARIGTTGSGSASRRGWTSCATAASRVAREDSCAAGRVKRLRTNTSARLREDASQKRETGGRRRRANQHRRDRAAGSKQEQGFRVQRVHKGREWPASPNLLSAAFPDFQGDAGVKFLTGDLSRMDLLRKRKTVGVAR